MAKAPRLSGETRGDARIQEQKIVQRIAGKFRVDELDLRRRLAALRRRSTKPRPAVARQAADGPADESAAKPPAATDPWELAVLQLTVAHPESFAAISRRIGTEAFCE